MDRTAAAQQARRTIAGYLEGKGLELVDVICRYEGRGLFLRLLVDWPEGGISIEECAGLNREISVMLEEKNILEQPFTLEVSSPGLDRPLKTENDFRRCKGKLIKFFLNEMLNGKLEWDGIIENVTKEAVAISVQGALMEISLSKVNKAKQLL